MTRIIAYFYDAPMSLTDQACRHIFESVGAKRIGAGTMLVGVAAGERDVEYEVPESEVEHVKARLVAAGFRLIPTKIEEPEP